MKTQHTSGPWSIGLINHKKQRVDIDSLSYDKFMGYKSWRGLARTYGCEDFPEKGSEAMMANARLIAAAPELLEALEKLVKAVDFTEVKTPNPLSTLGRALRTARAALAKTTGEQT